MIRVLQVYPQLNNAGTEMVIMNLYRNIDKEKIQFDFLVQKEGELDEIIKKMGARIYYIDSENDYRKKLRKFFEEHKEFRSMCVDADKKLKEYLANNDEARKEFEENQKLKNDPRITKIGDFLRKTSIDELPQLINVLKGEMSLIGPRPIVDGEIEKYGTNKDKFLSVKPGLTGYWAANGRNNITYSERIKMELYYVDNMSFGLDLKIFFKTIVSVIKKEGAN